MEPLIKWPGGKRGEFIQIKDLIPKYEKYIEPFFGGGAVFFALEPKKSAINDISVELIQFYKNIKTKKNRDNFKFEIFQLLEKWEHISDYLKVFEDDFLNLYLDYRKSKIEKNQLKKKINFLFDEKIKHFNGIFDEKFTPNPEKIQSEIEDALYYKFLRMKTKLDVSSGFTNISILDNIETAFRSGFYNRIRELYNQSIHKKINLTKEKESSFYYFIREFCYASMFRYNSKGEFNIPYGGMGYNKKKWRTKIEQLFSNKTISLMSKAIIYNEDFYDFMKRIKPTSKDFIFLDPPYDTEFSDYAGNEFNKNDQKRLADFLYKTKAKFIMIIKETPFIKELYSSNKNKINVSSFEKTYLYNVKGRNDRGVNHLLIKNF